MYSGPQHPILLEMEALARQQRFLREAARDRLLRQARAARVRPSSPWPNALPAALVGIARDLLRRTLARLPRGIGPRSRASDPEYQTG